MSLQTGMGKITTPWPAVSAKATRRYVIFRIQCPLSQTDTPCKPQLHIHYRVLSLAELPIGQISGDGQEATQAEKDAFASWVLQQWRIKDALLGHFYETGSFEGGDNVASDTATDMPLQLLDDKDVLRLVGGILPGLAITYETTKVLIKEMFY